MTTISGWIFVAIGLVITAISIFMYDTLKLFIVLGILMALYGLAKLSFKRMRKFLEPPDIEGQPVHVKEANNPYLAKHNKEILQRQQRQQHQQQRLHQHNAPVPQQRIASQARYCHSCGAHIAVQHRFCGYCGQRQ